MMMMMMMMMILMVVRKQLLDGTESFRTAIFGRFRALGR